MDRKKITHEDKKEIPHKENKEIETEVLKEIAYDEPLELKEESRKNLESDLIRLQAEFENFRKRCEKEMKESNEKGKMQFASSLLSFMDEFENALIHLKGEDLKGMQMLFGNFRKIMNETGVREMECIGEKLDPYQHDVLMQEESEKPAGTIVKVLRKGYYFKDKVLRHAQVAIAKEKNNTKKGE
ncbi:nucleotide exchange factor GrpE [Candidatus Micrarchaeota archaeon]|nr:nucleotide exchange factor GrpE [Candidatus Micrarchaeota archaeon]